MSLLSTLQPLSRACPYLKNTSLPALARSLQTGGPAKTLADGAARLEAVKAGACPVMGAALEAAKGQRGYAAVADRAAVDEFHREAGVPKGARGVCPHAAAGHRAAQQAQQLAAESARQAPATVNPLASAMPPAAMHQAAPTSGGKFDYPAFYAEELDKKHRDKSYRCVDQSGDSG